MFDCSWAPNLHWCDTCFLGCCTRITPRNLTTELKTGGAAQMFVQKNNGQNPKYSAVFRKAWILMRWKCLQQIRSFIFIFANQNKRWYWISAQNVLLKTCLPVPRQPTSGIQDCFRRTSVSFYSASAEIPTARGIGSILNFCQIYCGALSVCQVATMYDKFSSDNLWSISFPNYLLQNSCDICAQQAVDINIAAWIYTS